MPNLSGMPALDVALGLSFFYFLLSIVASSINEAIAVAFRFRAKTLEHGIFSLLGDPHQVEKFFRHWRVGALIKPVSKTRNRDPKRERRPSYIPSRVFALTVLDRFVLEDPAGNSTDPLVSGPDVIKKARDAVQDKAGNLPEPIKGLLTDALNEAGDDLTKLQNVLERSFDEVMDRASGWYKRRAQLILFVIALVLAAVINADSFAIGQRLWKDDALRSAVVAQAQKGVDSTDASLCPAPEDNTKVGRAAQCVSDVKALDLPLGWEHWPHSFSGIWNGITGGYSKWALVPGKVFGLLITAFALTLGAPFWFDLLGKIARLRGSGPPGESKQKGAQAPTEPAAT